MYLAVFSGQITKQIFRKIYKKALDGQLYIYKNNLYTFDQDDNDLIVLNPSNGTLIKKYNHILGKHVDSYFFADSSLIVELLGDHQIYRI